MPFHAKDLRAGRYSNTGNVYLTTAVTRNRENIFCSHLNARILVNTLKRADENRFSSTLGFVVMPDHFHWVFQLGSSKNLSSTIQFVKGGSAFEINRYALRKKFHWQPGFHDHAIRRDENLIRVLRYVIANPLRAGLVESIGDYAYWDCVFLQGGLKDL